MTFILGNCVVTICNSCETRCGLGWLCFQNHAHSNAFDSVRWLPSEAVTLPLLGAVMYLNTYFNAVDRLIR